MFQLIATDMDGTLLNSAGEVTPRTARALRRAMDGGIRVALSSGRMIEAMVPFAEALKVNAPMIVYNGALIYDYRTGETLYRKFLNADAARSAARLAEEMGIYLQVFPGRGYCCQARTRHTDYYESNLRVPCTVLGRKVSEFITGDVAKLLAIGDPERLQTYRTRLKAEVPTGLNAMFSRTTFLEILSDGIDKGEALRALAAQMGIALRDVIAFGDSENDASLLSAAGTGIAMGNCVDACRKICDRVAPTNDEDGLAQVLEEYFQ